MRCSRKCAMPDLPRGSSAPPTLYHTIWVTTGARWLGMTTTSSRCGRVNPSAPKRSAAPCWAALSWAALRGTAPGVTTSTSRTTRRATVLKLGIKRSWSATGMSGGDGTRRLPRHIGRRSVACDRITPPTPGRCQRRLEDTFEQRLLFALDDRRLALGHRLAGGGVLAQALRLLGRIDHDA